MVCARILHSALDKNASELLRALITYVSDICVDTMYLMRIVDHQGIRDVTVLQPLGTDCVSFLFHAQRGAHGVILVYDVSKRESFDSLKNVWLKEVEMYCTRKTAVKMVVGNKVDIDDRQVSHEEGLAFARETSTLFVESSAKTSLGVKQTFEELICKILQTPELCAVDSASNGSIRPGASSGGTSISDCAC